MSHSLSLSLSAVGRTATLYRPIYTSIRILEYSNIFTTSFSSCSINDDILRRTTRNLFGACFWEFVLFANFGFENFLSTFLICLSTILTSIYWIDIFKHSFRTMNCSVYKKVWKRQKNKSTTLFLENIPRTYHTIIQTNFIIQVFSSFCLDIFIVTHQKISFSRFVLL